MAICYNRSIVYKLIAFILVALVLFGCFCVPDAQAEAIVLGTVGIAVIGFVIVAMGITLVSDADFQTACADIYSKLDDTIITPLIEMCTLANGVLYFGQFLRSEAFSALWDFVSNYFAVDNTSVSVVSSVDFPYFPRTWLDNPVSCSTTSLTGIIGGFNLSQPIVNGVNVLEQGYFLKFGRNVINGEFFIDRNLDCIIVYHNGSIYFTVSGHNEYFLVPFTHNGSLYLGIGTIDITMSGGYWDETFDPPLYFGGTSTYTIRGYSNLNGYADCIPFNTPLDTTADIPYTSSIDYPRSTVHDAIKSQAQTVSAVSVDTQAYTHTGTQTVALEAVGVTTASLDEADTNTGILSKIWNWLKEILQKIWEILTSIGTAIANGFTSVIEWLRSLFGDLMQAVRSIGLSISEFFSDFWERLRNIVTPASPLIPDNFGSGFGSIWHYVAEWLGYISGFLSLILTVWGKLPYGLVVPVYACVTLILIFGLYRKFIK